MLLSCVAVFVLWRADVLHCTPAVDLMVALMISGCDVAFKRLHKLVLSITMAFDYGHKRYRRFHPPDIHIWVFSRIRFI